MGTDVCRQVKKDVLKIVRGPCKSSAPKNVFLLTALSHLKQIMSLCLQQLKSEQVKKKPKKEKSTDVTAPPWQTEILSGKVSRILEANKVKLAQKKIDFYLSWASECYNEYELFYQWTVFFCQLISNSVARCFNRQWNNWKVKRGWNNFVTTLRFNSWTNSSYRLDLKNGPIVYSDFGHLPVIQIVRLEKAILLST